MFDSRNASWEESLIEYPNYRYSLVGLELFNLGIIEDSRFFIRNDNHKDEELKIYISDIFEP